MTTIVRGGVSAAIALVLGGCGQDAPPPAEPVASEAEAAPVSVSTLSVDELADLMERSEVQLIDVRTPEEYAKGHLAGAINMPVDGFDPADLVDAPERETILYCQTARRSEIAARRLAAYEGRSVRHLEGGIAAWKETGLPVVEGEPQPAP